MALRIRADLYQASAILASTAAHSNIMEHISSKLEKNNLVKKKAEIRKREVDKLMKAMERELRSQNKIKMAKEEEMKAQEAEINAPEEQNGGCKKMRLDSMHISKVPVESTSTQEAEPEEATFSNHMKDAVQAVCQLCGSIEKCNQMRMHTKKVHGTSISAYKERFGPLIDHLVEAVYHRCGVCAKTLLLDADVIYPHAKIHGISFKAYTSLYMSLSYRYVNKA